MQKERNKGFISQYMEQMDQIELDFSQLALSVSEELAKKMKEKNISKADLANRLQTSRAYVTKILSGDANLSLKSLAKLQNALESRFEFSLTTKIENNISFKVYKPKNWAKYFNQDFEQTTPGNNYGDTPFAA